MHQTAESAGKAQRTNADDIELESALQELALDLGCDAVETNMTLREDGLSSHGGHGEACGEGQRESRLQRVKKAKVRPNESGAECKGPSLCQ
jgi:hypothetical protein